MTTKPSSAAWVAQALHGDLLLAGVEVHPHRCEQDQVESLPFLVEPRQAREKVINPPDRG